MQQPAAFAKRCRLKSIKDIETLFRTGEAFFVHPYRVIIQKVPCVDSHYKVMFGAPKKRFKTAVQRNRIKRMTREALRLQQQLFGPSGDNGNSTCLHIALIYSFSTVEPYDVIYESIGKILRGLQRD
jgi:ribonuclease P protein component